MERVEDFIKRYQNRNQKDRLGEYNDDEWLQLEKELEEIWKNATDEEKKLLSKRIAFESFIWFAREYDGIVSKRKLKMTNNMDQSDRGAAGGGTEGKAENGH